MSVVLDVLVEHHAQVAEAHTAFDKWDFDFRAVRPTTSDDD